MDHEEKSNPLERCNFEMPINREGIPPFSEFEEKVHEIEVIKNQNNLEWDLVDAATTKMKEATLGSNNLLDVFKKSSNDQEQDEDEEEEVTSKDSANKALYDIENSYIDFSKYLCSKRV